jgi:hypothetical protein
MYQPAAASGGRKELPVRKGIVSFALWRRQTDGLKEKAESEEVLHSCVLYLVFTDSVSGSVCTESNHGMVHNDELGSMPMAVVVA